MQKLVIDTNVIVSSLIQRSYPYLIIDQLFLRRKIGLCISDELLAEYQEVLARDKFLKFPDFFIKSESLLVDIKRYATQFFPTSKVDLIKDDDDNMLLELAEKCEADFIVTGNTRDFTFPIYKQTKIVTPREYWENQHPAILSE